MKTLPQCATLAAVLLAPLLLDGCAALYWATGNDARHRTPVDVADQTKARSYDVTNLTADNAAKSKGKTVPALDQFLYAYNRACAQQYATSSQDSNLNRQYLEAGLRYSDLLATVWFEALLDAVKNDRYNVNVFNEISTTALGVLGIARANTTILTSVGLAQGFVNAEDQNYSASYLLTPEVQALEKKWQDMRAELKKKILDDPTSFDTYDHAHDALYAYDSTRSIGFIQNFLRQATELAQFSVGNPTAFANQTQENVALSTLEVALGVNSSLSPDDAFQIYGIVYKLNLPSTAAWSQRNTNLVDKVNAAIAHGVPGAIEESLRTIGTIEDFAGRITREATAAKANAGSATTPTPGTTTPAPGPGPGPAVAAPATEHYDDLIREYGAKRAVADPSKRFHVYVLPGQAPQ